MTEYQCTACGLRVEVTRKGNFIDSQCGKLLLNDQHHDLQEVDDE